MQYQAHHNIKKIERTNAYIIEWISGIELYSFESVIKEKAEGSITFGILETKSFIRPWLREIWPESDLQQLTINDNYPLMNL